MRVRLGVGDELDRPRARELARDCAALARSTPLFGRSPAASNPRRSSIVGSGSEGSHRGWRETLNRLERVGLVDDERYAMRRAESLSERGQGDEAIRWRLERDGVPVETAAKAVAALPPERQRARLVVAAQGTGVRPRELARRGFGEDAVEEALGEVVADAP